jgi:DNA ligase 1
MLILPILYKPSKTGVTQSCVISAHNGFVTVAFGQLGGKQQVKDTQCEPKNVGRSNETTQQQQAELEARAKWEKKQKEGYSETIQEKSTVNLPMKIHTYQEHSHKIVFPCFVSPKLNGVNAEYHLLPEPHITSRGGEQYPYVESRDAHVFKVMKHHGVDSINGEIYIHGQHLQDIQSAVKKPSSTKLQPTFFAFDLPTFNGAYENRLQKLRSISKDLLSKYQIESIVVGLCRTEDEIYKHHKLFISQGYEGTIIRNATGLYEYNTRSYDVLKLKDAQDAEFIIISHNVDKNEHPVFICETKEGKQFKVKPKGTDSDRKDILNNISHYIGQYYTVEFEVYSKDLIPQKPVGIGLRKCDEHGSPLQ